MPITDGGELFMRPLSILPAAVALIVTLIAADLVGQEQRPRPNLANPLSTRHEPSAPRLDKAWPKLVESFAKALVDGDRQVIDASLAAKSYIRKFDSNEFEEPAQLTSRAAKSTLVGQHAYVQLPLVMAADVAADFKQATVVPEKIRTLFLIDDELEIKRANATAVQWVVEQLEAKQNHPIAIIVLWAPKSPAAKTPDPAADPEPANANTNDKTAQPTYEPVFFLLRGEETDPHKFRINYIVYGNPLPDDQ
jgi:hypothetical protein